jgi:glycine cleavage system H protein
MTATKFTEDHEWARLEPDGTVTVGITGFAQEQLGDIVFVQLPEAGSAVAAGAEAAVVESVKAAAEVKMPLGGRIVAVNERLVDAPDIVNSSPMDDGWFFRLEPDDRGDFDTLLDAEAYGKLTAE